MSTIESWESHHEFRLPSNKPGIRSNAVRWELGGRILGLQSTDLIKREILFHPIAAAELEILSCSTAAMVEEDRDVK